MSAISTPDAERDAALAAPWSLSRTRRLLLAPQRPTWPEARLVQFDTPIDARAARRLLPGALRLAEPARASWFVAEYAQTSFGVAYRECGLLLHARLRRRAVLHCAWMVVDDDSALILGRELLGFPKKLAQIEFTDAGDRVAARVSRRGVELLCVEGRLGADSAPRRAFPLPIVNVRGLPSLAPALLWRMEVPERFHAGRSAALSVAVRGSAHDPLAELVAGACEVEGSWLRVDLGVPPPDAGAMPRGVRPVGLVSPAWLARLLPFRSL
jgi:acetoacetate decarboxylase